MNDELDRDPEFTDEELRAALKDIGKDAREAAFAAGQSIMVARDSRLMLIHPDGSEETVALLYSRSMQ